MLRGRWQRNDRQPTFRACGSTEKIDLPTSAAVDLRADAIRANLAAQIDLQRGVDRDPIVVLANQERVVDEVGWMQFDHGVIVNPVEQPTRAKQKASHKLAAMPGLGC